MKILVVPVFIGLLALNAWLFLIRPKKPWTERVSFVLQLVGIYTLGLGILAQTDLFRDVGGLGEEMTSPNLFEFAAGNLRFLGIIFVISSMAFTTSASGPGFLVLVVYAPALFAYAAFHLLIVMPLAYIPYVIASVPIDAVLHSTTDFTLSRDGSALHMKAFVAENAVSLKSFLVALPALVLAVSGKMFALYKRNRPER
jgi:hypothetical protein